MSDTTTPQGPVVLGGVVLAGFDSPSRIRYSTKVDHVIHRFSSGGRVFDMMGGNPGPIRWSGQLIGPDRFTQQSALETIRKAKKFVKLTWTKWSLDVMVVALNYTEEFNRIDYDITVEMNTVVATKEAAQNDTGEADQGTGEKPASGTAAKDSGQQATRQARSTAPTGIPIPPVPPDAPSRPAYSPSMG